MGFIEDLRKKMVAKEQAQLIASQNAEREKIAVLGKARDKKLQEEKEKRDREGKWAKAKAHFEETGVRGMLNSIVDLKAAVYISEDQDNNPGKYVNLKSPKENFSVWLRITETKSEFSQVRIVTSADGTLTFHGASATSVPKTEWESNRAILEETLGKAYNQPEVHRDSEPQGFRSQYN